MGLISGPPQGVISRYINNFCCVNAGVGVDVGVGVGVGAGDSDARQI